MKVVRFGQEAWLVYTDQPLALAAALPGAVPGDGCVLVRDIGALAALATLPEPAPAPPVTLPAIWDGQDLAAVRQACGLDVVEQIRERTFTVAFCGFSPGFAYMRGLPAALHLPRRARPRAQVPAGSIAIAAGYLAVYPSASPGGWHLVGRCSTVLFDPDRQPPALLTPGTRVRFT